MIKNVKDVERRFGVILYEGLRVGKIERNLSMMLQGQCLLIDSDVQCKAEELPLKISGCVIEHWGVRTRDGIIEVFVLNVAAIDTVDVGGASKKPSLISFFVKPGANIVVMRDSIAGTGCICGVLSESRISENGTDFVRPAPFNKHDPYAFSVVEVIQVGDYDDVIEEMRKMASSGDESPESSAGESGQNEGNPETGAAEGAGEPVNQPEPDNGGSQPDEEGGSNHGDNAVNGKTEQKRSSASTGSGGEMLSSEEINALLNGLEEESKAEVASGSEGTDY